jgi:two-component system phosphate regulon response regulator PhoB
MEYSMQQGTAWPGVGHPVEHLRNTAGAVRGRTHSAADVIDTAYLMGPAVKPLVLLAGEKGFIRLLKRIVENNGFSCILTEDFAEAIALAEIERPDLISLDDMLPRGSTLATRRKIYQNPRTRHIPVLILAGSSAWSEGSTMWFAQSANDIVKPILPDAFIGRLHDLVRRPTSAIGTNVRFSDIVVEHEAHRVYRSQRRYPSQSGRASSFATASRRSKKSAFE